MKPAPPSLPRYPDVPADLPLCLWDRQEHLPVVTLADRYAQLMALETLPDGAPFTALADWLNATGNDALASEGLPVTRNT